MPDKVERLNKQYPWALGVGALALLLLDHHSLHDIALYMLVVASLIECLKTPLATEEKTVENDVTQDVEKTVETAVDKDLKP